MLVTAIIIEIVAIGAFIFAVSKTFRLPSLSPVPIEAALQRKRAVPLLVILPGNSRKRSKTLAYGAFGLSILLYSSFALATHDALGRINAIIFTALQMMLLVPCALFLLIRWRRLLTQEVLFRGMVLGSCLASALLCLTYSFKSAGILETTILMSLNGLVAAGIAVFVLRQKLSNYTQMACVCSAVGIILIWLTTFQHWQGNVTAFVGGALMTLSAFLVERLLIPITKREKKMLWPILGVQMVTMAGVSLVIALCFGEWESLYALRVEDLPLMMYTSIGTIFVPLVLTASAQKHVNAVTIAFLSILEPLLTTLFAVILGERLSTLAYLGGLVILVSIVLQATASARPDQMNTMQIRPSERVSVSEVHGKPDRNLAHPVRLGIRAQALVYLLSRYPQGIDLSGIQQLTRASRSLLHQELMLLRLQGYVILQDDRRYMLHTALLQSVRQFSASPVTSKGAPVPQVVSISAHKTTLPKDRTKATLSGASKCPVAHKNKRPAQALVPLSVVHGESPVTLQERITEAEAYLRLLQDEAGLPCDDRLSNVTSLIKDVGTYQHTSEELEWGAKIAWRNSTRCTGRLHWRNLDVRDMRHLTTAESIFEACVEHIKLATNGGKIRSTMTVFAPPRPEEPGPRIWNPQLIRYAGYQQADGTVVGDPAYVALTNEILKLGWKGGKGTPFDILPLVIQVPDKQPELFELPPEIVLEVPIEHPHYSWFAGLGLKWHALPAVSNMRLEIGGVSYTAAPFNGWYLGTEIGARNLADQDRYNMLPVIADKLGLEKRQDRTLWKDKALVELNVAVLHSFAKAGITMVDHHTVARQLVVHEEKEKQAGRCMYADWAWVVPPMSGSTTPVFHRPYENKELSPNFFYQVDPWKERR